MKSPKNLTTSKPHNLKTLLPVMASVLLMLFPIRLSAQETDGAYLETVSEDYGACVYADGKSTGIRMEEPFAMHSVMKFPQAIYVAECLQKRKGSLNETVKVSKADLMQETWSPMLKTFDKERDFSYAELLELSLVQSDNNACDILFKLFGGPEKVEQYLCQIGFTDIHVKWTEREMNIYPKRSSDNSCTPLGMARLFEWFYHHKEQNEHLHFVWDTMAACQTGSARLASIIPEGSVFIHKTGTGFPSKDKRQDRNDVGIIIMPDGTYQIVAVFAPQSTKESDVADIGKKYIRRK